MATPTNSPPWHAIFAFLIPTTGTIVQMNFPNSSPLDEHPASIWIFIICSLFYCFAFGYHIKCQIYTPSDTIYLNLSVKVAFISGSLAYTSLISVLIPPFLQPLVFIACLMLLFAYFNRHKIAEIGDNTVSYLYDRWSRTEGHNVPATRRPPV